ncbi:Uncharacterised protein [Salmonella enterica subsp. enterica]|nr:Uncharacterised protein [Salmonella enterica subsp. enterica]
MFRSTFQHLANTKQKRLSPVYALNFVVLMASADLPPPTFIFHNSSLGIFSEKFSEPYTSAVCAMRLCLKGCRMFSSGENLKDLFC